MVFRESPTSLSLEPLYAIKINLSVISFKDLKLVLNEVGY